jgi:alpha-D-ribose 1-methylphosphonate 5-triphosphate diphosphatase
VTDIFIEGGRALLGAELLEATLQIADGKIGTIGSDGGRGSFGLDAAGLKVLPGIVDLHGDAFERQIMPRPGVDFPIDVALVDSDRQAIGNGITTVFHATTWSWEPGLRSADNARQLLGAIESLRPQLAADTRFHLRHETYNLDAEAEIAQWLSGGRVDLFAFNDHMESIVTSAARPRKRAQMVERCGIPNEEFDRLVERVVSRAHEVPASIARLAATARSADVRMLSHDDDSPEMRKAFRAHGGSHTGWTRAADMIAKGLCSILASDYYYPAQLLAAFRLDADGVLPLAQAWDLISAAPARAAGLTDRGVLAEGRRADIILVDDDVPLRPRIVAIIAAGRLVHLTDANRLVPSSHAPRKAVAAA